MSELIANFKCTTGTAELYADKIVIRKRAMFGRREKIIFLSQLSGVIVKKATMSGSPTMHFSVANSDMKKRNKDDDNSLKFTNMALKAAYEFRDSVEKQMSIFRTPIATNVSVNSISSADELLKYKGLLDQGVISQEEFDLKKKQLLNI